MPHLLTSGGRRLQRLAAGGLLGVVFSACAAGTPQTRGIQGVWAFVSETDMETGELVRDDSTWTGIWIFTQRYHCLARMANGRQALAPEELRRLSGQERADYLDGLLRYSSTAGTYKVNGNDLLRQWDVSLGPGIIGMASTARFTVDGDELTVDLPRRSPDTGPAVRVVYRRLE